MKLKAAIVVAFAFAVVAGGARSEDMDIRELAAKLAAQEAMMADIEAKLASSEEGGNAADAITSLRKNATVTLGGLVTTGVFHGSGKVKNRFDANGEFDAAERLRTTDKYRATDVSLSDAELYAEIEVNDNFEAFLSLDLHTAVDADDNYGIAKSYYVRWKNICDTGFSLKVGRDSAVFGDDVAEGYLDNMSQGGGGDGMSWWGDEFGDVFMPYNGWDIDAATQVTAAWEGFDDKLKLELSLFQNVWNDDGIMNYNKPGARYSYDRPNGARYYRSRNYGFGSGSLRATYTPIEDLTFSASVINYRSNHSPDVYNEETEEWDINVHDGNAKNNTAVALSFNYRPCWFNKMRVWGQWVHGWNAGNVKNMDSDVVNAGMAFDLTENVTLFAQGDYLKTRHKEGGVRTTGKGWAAYAGVIYNMPIGTVLEAGWRHDQYKVKQGGTVMTKAKGDMFYATLGFEF